MILKHFLLVLDFQKVKTHPTTKGKNYDAEVKNEKITKIKIENDNCHEQLFFTNHNQIFDNYNNSQAEAIAKVFF
ncbi:putative SP-containing protein [Vairimorpha necatrix]|uniref:SP-containing protein n=1 Tax=Vairimorpha necatrix TaxID=6039 RepID=A0AAX4J9Q6_9MICR